MESANTDDTNEQSAVDSDLLMAETTSNDFDDALNRLMGGQTRPETEEDVEEFKTNLLASLVDFCGQDATKWKALVLALTYKRFHLKAPEAKISLKEARANADKEPNDSKTTVGNGERRLFYVAVGHLFQELLETEKPQENSDSVASALQCLLEIAPLAGGSRDVCSLIEMFVGAALLGNESFKEKRSQIKSFFGSESLSLLVAFGVQFCTKSGLQNDQAQAALDILLQLAADTLEQDKTILEARASSGEDQEDAALPSTLHVFLPHRDRGKPSKKKAELTNVPNRQLVNSVAEILIWARTSFMDSNKAFQVCYQRLLEATGISNESKAKAKSALQTLQTIIRKERKKFNDFARSQGFMLCDLFQQDQTALKMKQILKGKDGDITQLNKLATKKGDAQVLRMISARFAADPSKIARFESVRAVIRAWSSLTASTEGDNAVNQEVAELEHGIKMAQLRATIQNLRKTYKRKDRTVVLASLDSTVDSHVGALLVSAALGDWDLEDTIQNDGDVKMADASEAVGCRLHLPGGAVHDVDSFQKVCDLLAGFVTEDPEIFPSMAESDGSATIKAVVNLIDKHLGANQTLLVFSSTDLNLPTECAEKLVKQDSSIHRHDTDDLQHRLNREGAKRGDITISLSWETHDDLDLHVILPCGEEVDYSKNVSTKGKANLDVDMNANPPYSIEPVENIFIGDLDKNEQAPHGMYKVIVQNFSYNTKGSEHKTAIPWRVVVNKDGKTENFLGECIGSGSSSNVVVCEFQYTGRTSPLPKKKDQPSGASAASVNITTSIGQTLEALCQAIKAVGQQEQLNQVRQLLQEDDDEKEEEEEKRPIVSATYEVTNRDRNQVLIFNLPSRFHGIVHKKFDGGDLAEQAAEAIAKRMVQDKIPLSELKRCGYPVGIVEAVQAKMKVV